MKPTKEREEPRRLILRGARENNLKSLDLDLPLDQLIAFAGPSGSGKSSLVFDTIYAEGQRRYLEALSLHLQGMADAFSRPKVDLIEGIPPMIAVKAMAASPSSRATIGSVSEILPYLRLLLVKAGRLRCADGSFAAEGRSPASIAAELVREREEGARFMVLAPLYGLDDERLRRLVREGWTRFYTPRGIVEAGELLPKDLVKTELLIDRLAIRDRSQRRLREAIEQAYEQSGGAVALYFPEGEERLFFQETPGCPGGEVLPALDYELLDSNRPEGRCERCLGAGTIEESLEKAAETPKGAATKKTRSRKRDEEGAEAGNQEGQKNPECPECRGTRLSSIARRAHLGEYGIEALLSMDLGSLRRALKTLELGEAHRAITEEPLALIDERLDAIEAIGLSYLSAKRALRTLSGGEVSRLRLAQQLGARLTGILYALDEPSSGLHPADLGRLIAFLRELVSRGNGALLVEHSLPLIRETDLLVELGPRGGEGGGELVAQGAPARLFADGASPTGEALERLKDLAGGRHEPRSRASSFITIRGARANNLKDLSVSIPKARFVCVTGRSGSGKSSLIFDELLGAVKRARSGNKSQKGDGAEVDGIGSFDRLIVVDASPIGRSARSIPLTSLQIFDAIRELYAALPDARARGWKASRFSFNIKGGRCERCEGLGVIAVDMRFLPDLEIDCEECLGARYKDELEEVRFKGYSIGRLLQLSVSEAIELFEAFPTIDARLKTLEQLGLGYLRLGQRANTLSSGEAQRLRLARELSMRARSNGSSLFLLDEPSRGLHLSEVDLLIRALESLVDRGHSVIAIEHHLALMLAADHLIDLGPGAGPEGGALVAEGSPHELIASGEGATAEALRAFTRAGG